MPSNRTTRIARHLVASDVVRLPIDSLIMRKSELEAAISNISRGYPAVTEGPVEVAYLKRSRRYELVNGYHRMVGYLLAGETSVLAKVSEGTWKLPPMSDRFVFQPELPFKGLEDFTEPYMLRRL